MKRAELIEMHGQEETIRQADDELRVVLNGPESPANAEPQKYGETTLYQGGIASNTDDSRPVSARIEDRGSNTLTYAAVKSGAGRYATEHETSATDAVGWADVDRQLPDGKRYKHVFGQPVTRERPIQANPVSAAKAAALVTKLARNKIDRASKPRG